MNFKERFEAGTELINNRLDKYIQIYDRPEKRLFEAMRYSLIAGGKRLRPVLSLAAAELLGVDENEIVPYACSIEMIHTYSLIHDDLPAMDNDTLRRGKPTNHVVFGEAAAILAGDALLNLAFETMCADALLSENAEALRRKLEAISFIAESAGTDGMIAGQMIDIESQHKILERSELEDMHKKKTGALIKAAVLTPAIISGANPKKKEALQIYADCFGLAFQIKDDILDVEGKPDELGKTTGKDSENGKATFVSVYGLEVSKEMLSAVTAKATEALSIFGDSADFLKKLNEYMSLRTR